MKTSIKYIFILSITAAITACKSGSDRNEPAAPLVPKATVITPKPENEPRWGERADFVHFDWQLQLHPQDDRDSIRITTLAWCEIARITEDINSDVSREDLRQGYYCIHHEIGRIEQNGRVGYFSRRFDSPRDYFGKKGFASSLSSEQPEQLWKQSSEEWDLNKAQRENVKPFITRIVLDWNEYKKFSQAEHGILTDRCRLSKLWKKARDLTFEKQGNFTFTSRGLSALSSRVPNLSTLIEIDPVTLEARFIGAIYAWTKDERLDVTHDEMLTDAKKPDGLREYFASYRFKFSTILQEFNPRRDDYVRAFARGCSFAYNQVVGRVAPYSECHADWRSFLPRRTKSGEQKASVHLDQIWPDWESILRAANGSPLYRETSNLNQLWSGLPIEGRAVIPDICRKIYPPYDEYDKRKSL